MIAHRQGPISNPELPPAAPSGDPFCLDIALSPDLPGDVALDPASLEPEERQLMFDCLAWRTFVALNWPAQTEYRGQPDRSKDLGHITNGQVTDDIDGRTYEGKDYGQQPTQ